MANDPAKSSLDPPDSHHLRAAMGWLELGNQDEAGLEISRISAENLDDPDVLEVRWSICAAGNSWEAAWQVAEKLVAKAPDRSSGWIHRAYAIRRAPGGSLQRAWDALYPALERFPTLVLIPYNLACYAAQFGRVEEAWNWLRKALEVSNNFNAVKAMALRDSDLEPLWDRIRKL